MTDSWKTFFEAAGLRLTCENGRYLLPDEGMYVMLGTELDPTQVGKDDVILLLPDRIPEFSGDSCSAWYAVAYYNTLMRKPIVNRAALAEAYGKVFFARDRVVGLDRVVMVDPEGELDAGVWAPIADEDMPYDFDTVYLFVKLQEFMGDTPILAEAYREAREVEAQ